LLGPIKEVDKDVVGDELLAEGCAGRTQRGYVAAAGTCSILVITLIDVTISLLDGVTSNETLDRSSVTSSVSWLRR
jgi:hypothetical protein